MGYDVWLPIAPKVQKVRSVFNAAALAYIGDCIYELYAHRHFLFPALSIEEYNDRVTAVVRCEAQFQQQAESEGVQPNHTNNMPNSISKEPINRLPSNFGGSAHQSQLFYMPNSSSEEPIHPLPSNLRGSSHQSDQFFEPEIELEEEEAESEAGGGVQPNVNPGGSAHHPQLTEAQITANYEIGTAEHLKKYQSLHNAAKRGDWEGAIRFIEKDPNALAARITVDSKTVFHVAALCDQWEFILKLLELVSSPESIAVQDNDGKTVLHYVAQAGSLQTAKALVQKNAVLPQIGDGWRSATSQFYLE